MKHDVAFANQTVRLLETRLEDRSRDVSGPPMIRMLALALAAGLLFALGLAFAGTTGMVASLAVGWCAAMAVLAIQSAVYSRAASARFASRCSALGWSTIGAAS